MKNFTIIPNEAGSIFKPTDLYTLTCMYLTTNNNYCTDITREQLAKITGLSFSYIKDKFLPRLKQSNFCTIETYKETPTKSRNIYKLSEPKINYKIVQKGVIEDSNLTPQEKGFLIALHTTSFNNSYDCGLSENTIIKKINTSKNTYYKYKNILLHKGYIFLYKDEVNTSTIHENFSFGYSINCTWLGSEKMQIKYQELMKENIEDIEDILKAFESKKKQTFEKVNKNPLIFESVYLDFFC